MMSASGLIADRIPGRDHTRDHEPDRVTMPSSRLAMGVTALQRATGGFRVAIGTRMHVACHQFRGSAHALLRLLDLSALRPRLALTIGGTTAIALLSVVAYVADGEQQRLTSQALAVQQGFAMALAQDVDDYVNLHRAAVLLLAEQPGLRSMPGGALKTLLSSIDHVYPNLSALAIHDADGQLVARNDNAPGLPIIGSPVFEDARRTLRPSLDVLVSPQFHRPIVALGAPILAPDGHFDGVVTGALDADLLVRMLTRASGNIGSMVYVVDHRGRVIARSGSGPTTTFDDLSNLPPVAAVLVGSASSGSLVYGEGDARRFAGYAPVADLGWGIVVEQPAATALAPARTGLDLSIELIALIVVIAVTWGAYLAGRLVTPLTVLTRAVDRFAHGDDTAPLPETDIREIARLTSFFHILRERLTARTAERDVAEEKLRATNSQLEDAVRELEAFSYSVSHDLRAPLRAMDGFTRIVVEDCGSTLEPDARALLGHVRSNARQMARLIDDLLAFSQLSRQQPRRQTVDTIDLVEKVLANVRHGYDAGRLDVRVGHLPPCQADPALLRQVWVNLLSNALKFSRGRDLAVVEIGCRVEGDEPIYFVKDNGVGFDMTYAAKLFAVFQRLHLPEEFEGSGVGLAIVQRIVRRHHGRIWADATPNGGATFYFTLGDSTAERDELP